MTGADRSMKGKWAAGIAPRGFTWVIRDRLAISERPGGFASTHRRVRRKEELIWLRNQGFNKIISLMGSPHNFAAYDEHKLPFSNHPVGIGPDPKVELAELFDDIDSSLNEGMRILIHQEELGDRMMGTVAGYLVWSGRLASEHQAIALMEHLIGHQMGSTGRELVVEAVAVPKNRS